MTTSKLTLNLSNAPTNIVRAKAYAYLQEHGTLVRADFITHLYNEGIPFTDGNLAGALHSLSQTPAVDRTGFGVYTLNPAYRDQDAPTIASTIYNLLGETAEKLTELAQINILEIDPDDLEAVQQLRPILDTIESIRNNISPPY